MPVKLRCSFFAVTILAGAELASTRKSLAQGLFLDRHEDLTRLTFKVENKYGQPGDEVATNADRSQAPDDDNKQSSGLWEPPKNIIWQPQSKYKHATQLCIALSWVLILSSLPFIVPVIERKRPSNTEIAVGATMLVVLWAGFLLFTNVILFQSSHFDRIRSLTVIECTYFMAQIITTVGYGDIGPAKLRGQIFVALYVYGALFIIAMVISNITAHVANVIEEARKTKEARPIGSRRPSKSVVDIITQDKPSFKPLLQAGAVFLFFASVWILFFAFDADEGKTLGEATYMSVITLSTVGFGFITPQTEEGMVFASFWMLFGSAALVNLITEFATLMAKFQEYEKRLPTKPGAALDTDAECTLRSIIKGRSEVTEAEFLKFCLVHLKEVAPERVDEIAEAFQQLKPEAGKVRVRDIENTFATNDLLSPKKAKPVSWSSD